MRLPLLRLLTAMLAAALTAIVLGTGIELWVRAAWDPKRGSPGFYLSDPVLGQRLGENYDGWFAGVPVHINRLGLRDPRDYELAKKPNTFRILVLGDSVTFGHGGLFETTYPYLLEQRLRAWNPAVDWEVWNAAVPGYNTAQELAQLRLVGPRFKPDLVIVGFYDNDLIGNDPQLNPSLISRATAAIVSIARKHLYSIEFYRRGYYEIAWRLAGSDDYRRRLLTLVSDEKAIPSDASHLPGQFLSPYEWLTDDEVRDFSCYDGTKGSPQVETAIRNDPGFPSWQDAVNGFRDLIRAGQYRIVFFLNIVPRACPYGDRFYGSTANFNQFFVRIFAQAGPTVSVHDAFMHVRPSQMPNATGHPFGNSNAVKADVLFQYLRDHVLPDALKTSSDSASQ